MIPEEEVPIWERANIRSKELVLLKIRARKMLAALQFIQEIAAEDIRMGVVVSKSSIWQIEANARKAIEEAGK